MKLCFSAGKIAPTVVDEFTHAAAPFHFGYVNNGSKQHIEMQGLRAQVVTCLQPASNLNIVCNDFY